MAIYIVYTRLNRVLFQRSWKNRAKSVKKTSRTKRSSQAEPRPGMILGNNLRRFFLYLFALKVIEHV